MKRKIIAVIICCLVFSVLLCGCSAKDVLSAFSIDIGSTYDPAMEKVADVLGKTVSEMGKVDGDYTYSVYSDGTAVITAYSGNGGVLEIPSELGGHSVIGVENKSFYENEKITELILPDTLEAVGNYAFMYCKNLEKVTFGKDIKIIGVSAFESNGDDTKSEGKGSLTTLVFNGAPEKICQKAFYYDDKLTEIALPDGIKSIENWAFAKCFSADKIILGDGLEKIGDHAFLKCRGAKEIVIPDTCKLIETSAFYQCNSAEKLVIGNGVETLEKGAFEECSQLTDVVLPDSLKTMEPYIFYNCTSLKTCTGGGSIETIEKDIFDGAPEVKVIAPKDSVLAKYAESHDITLETA